MNLERTKNFVYSYKNYDESEKTITYQINFPYKNNYKELAHQIVAEKMDEINFFLDEHESRR